ncbi:hypothetical protein [Nisaea sp.]
MIEDIEIPPIFCTHSEVVLPDDKNAAGGARRRSRVTRIACLTGRL